MWYPYSQKDTAFIQLGLDAGREAGQQPDLGNVQRPNGGLVRHRSERGLLFQRWKLERLGLRQLDLEDSHQGG
jgi:hypothetical protein